MYRWVLLAGGGIVGTFLRYAIAGWMPAVAGESFPYGTLLINLSACLLIGLFDRLAATRASLGPEVRLLLMTGFCGAYSTFSTWILETSNLLRLKGISFSRDAPSFAVSACLRR